MSNRFEVGSLMYVSGGNLPSRWAHSIQIAKMSQAYAQILGHKFSLVTSGDLKSMFKGMDKAFRSWYGLHKYFKLIRLPVHLTISLPFPCNYRSKRYERLALLYACLRNPSFIKTRSPRIAINFLNNGFLVLFELHEPIGEADNTLKSVMSHENLIGIVTLSTLLKSNYMEIGANSEKILVCPSGVDLEIFFPHQTKESARKNLSINCENIVLYAGHLYDYKGIPVILKLAQSLKHCDFFLVGGWEVDIERIRKICEDSSLSNIHLLGYVSQDALSSYLYAADVLILPTSGSWQLSQVTSPLKLFDYMASQRPIVASNLPNIRTILQDNQNSLLVEPDNPKAFEDAILNLLNNSNLAMLLAKQAYQDVQSYTWEKRAHQILGFAAQRLATHQFSKPSLPERIEKLFKIFFMKLCDS